VQTVGFEPTTYQRWKLALLPFKGIVCKLAGVETPAVSVMNVHTKNNSNKLQSLTRIATVETLLFWGSLPT